MRRKALIVILGLLAAAAVAAARPEIPPDSVYQLRAALTDQGDAEAGLDVFQGKPVIVGMFYASCPGVCPLLIASVRRLENELDEKSRGRLRVLMVSLDPAADTPEALAGFAAQHRLDLRRWKLARSREADVRRLAAVLGVQYRKLPDGQFNHSTVVTLLDRDGRILAQTSRIDAADPDFLAAVRAATAGR